MRVGADQWVELEGVLRWWVHPLGDAVCRDPVGDPAFAPSPSEMPVGLWPFCILFMIGPQLSR